MITGTVTLGGDSVEGALVYVINDTYEELETIVTTDSTGTFEASVGDETDTFHVGVEYEDSNGEYHSESQPFVDGDATIDFTLDSYSAPSATEVDFELDPLDIWELDQLIDSYSDNILGVAVHPDTSYVAVRTNTDLIGVYDYGDDWEKVREIDLTGEVPNRGREPVLTFSTDGSWLFVVEAHYNGEDDDNRVGIIDSAADDAKEWERIRAVKTTHDTTITAVDTDRNAQFIATTGGGYQTDVFEIGTWGHVTNLPTDGRAGGLWFAENDDLLAVGDNDNHGYLFEVGDADGNGWTELDKVSDAEGNISGATISSDNQWVVFGSNDDTAYVYENDSGTLLLDETFSVGASPYSPKFDHTDSYLVLPGGGGDDSGTVRILTVPDWTPIDASPLLEAESVVESSQLTHHLLYGNRDGDLFGHYSPTTAQPDGVTVEVTETSSPIDAGETLEITARIKNTTPEAVTEDVTLICRGLVEDTLSVDLDSGATATVTLEWTTSDGDGGGGLRPAVRTSDDVGTAGVTVFDHGWEYFDSVGHYDDYITGVSVNPEGTYVAVAHRDGNGVDVFDYGDWSLAASFDMSLRPNASQEETLTFSPDGNWLCAAVEDTEENALVEIWDTAADDPANWTGEHQLDISFEHINGIDIDRNAQFLAVNGDEPRTELYELGSWDHITNVEKIDRGGGARFSPVDDYLVSGTTEGYHTVWTVGDSHGENWDEIDEWQETSSYIAGFAFSEDKQWLTIGSWDNTVYVHTVGDESGDGWGYETEVAIGGSPYSPVFGHDSDYLIAPGGVGSESGNVKLLETDTWSEITASPLDRTDEAIESADLGEHLVYGSRDGTVYIHYTPLDEEFDGFEASIGSTNSPIDGGETLEVTATITNEDGESDEQTVELVIGGVVRDERTLALGVDESQTVTFEWETNGFDDEHGRAAVRTDDSVATESITVEKSTITETFSTPGMHTWDVPNGVETVRIRCWGAAGGEEDGVEPAYGGHAKAEFAVSDTDTLEVGVGGAGALPEGGVNGGGDGGSSTEAGDGWGGGGRADVRLNSTNLEDALTVAGGGAGRGAVATNSVDEAGETDGGAGGPTEGEAGSNGSLSNVDATGGGGGGETSGGAGGEGSGETTSTGGSGEFGGGGAGGSGEYAAGGGGGGGWYGGGGGATAEDLSGRTDESLATGGGGGSNYIDESADDGRTFRDVDAGNNRDGKVEIEYPDN